LKNNAPLAVEASSGRFRGVLTSTSPSPTVLTEAPQARVSTLELSTWNDSEKAAVARQLVTLEVGLMQAERQQAADRERTSACMATFEQLLSGKLDKADQFRMPDTVAALQERTENSLSVLQQDIQAAHRGLVQVEVDRPDVLTIKRRVEALETVFPSRADAQEVSKMQLALSEASAKAQEHATQLRVLSATVAEHDVWCRRAQDHSVSLRTLDDKAYDSASKLFSVEARAAALESEMKTKADTSQHYTKDFTADLIKDLIKDFYRREEIDTMFSKVWWRTPDVAPTLTPRSKNGRFALPPLEASR